MVRTCSKISSQSGLIYVSVANLPAEIAHLLEEIQAKDRIVQDCRSFAASRDASIQKSLKANGAGQVNPKEEPYSKAILSNYEKAQVYQEEKIGLSDRAAVLLDRQIKRLDLKIRDLQNEGSIAIDPQLPSLLNNTSTISTRLPPLSTSTTGTSTPLQPLTGNAGPSTTIANTANPLARLVQPTHHTRQPSPLTTTAPITATSTLAPPSTRATRSPSTDHSQRRRLNATSHLSIPPTSSSLRQSSLGPGTPKSAANASSSRGGSAGPRPQSTTAQKTTSKPPRGPVPHQRIGHLNPSAAQKAKKRSRPSKRNKAGGSDAGNDSESVLSEVDGSNDAMDVDVAGEGEMGEGDEEEGEGDDRKYCTCQRVSFGDMVACDNDECPNEWFHWACVGVKEEPKGAWFCEECRAKLGK